jgi:hypothetical protein
VTRPRTSHFFKRRCHGHEVFGMAVQELRVSLCNITAMSMRHERGNQIQDGDGLVTSPTGTVCLASSRGIIA